MDVRRPAGSHVRVLVALVASVTAAWPVHGQERDVTRFSLDSLLAVPVHAAAGYAQALGDAAASVSVVTGEEICAFGYRTIGEVLSSVAVLYVTYGRNYTRQASAPVSANLRDVKVLARAAHRAKGITTAPWASAFDEPRTETIDQWLMLSATGRREVAPDISIEAAAAVDAYRPTGAYPGEATQARYESERLTLQGRSTSAVLLLVGRLGCQTTRHLRRFSA